MKVKILATAALMTLAAFGSASAADLSAPAPNYYKAPPPPPPVSTFTGCYIAGGGGYGFWTQDSFTRTTAGSAIKLKRDEWRQGLVRHGPGRLRL